MKIDPTLKIAPATTVATDERTRSAKQQTENSGAQTRADVQLSPLAAQLKNIEASLETTETVDSARVAEIKRSIAEGRFEVNAEKVADRLIDATREFMRAQKQ